MKGYGSSKAGMEGMEWKEGWKNNRIEVGILKLKVWKSMNESQEMLKKKGMKEKEWKKG